MADDNNNDRKRSVFSSLFSGSGLATILVALISQAIVSVVYQIVNNEQQAARIDAVQASLKTLTENVESLRTPLSVRVFKLEDKFDEHVRRTEEVTKRLDAIDIAGTRALSLVAANQQRVMAQLDRYSERLLMIDKRLGDMDVAAFVRLQHQIDNTLANIKRIEERLDRAGPQPQKGR